MSPYGRKESASSALPGACSQTSGGRLASDGFFEPRVLARFLGPRTSQKKMLLVGPRLLTPRCRPHRCLA